MTMMMRLVFAFLVALVMAWSGTGRAADCSAPTGPVEKLRTVMATGQSTAYQPTSLMVIGGQLTMADDASIRACCGPISTG